jgi:HD-like signal output (HDOD) protein
MVRTESISSILDQLIAKSQDLFSLPTVVTQVIEITRSEPVDMGALKNSIEFDPALTAKLLRVANSSFYGLRGEVTTLNQAVNVLGSRMVRTLVLNFSLPATLTQGIAPRVLERYWRKTIYRAVATRHFTRHFLPHATDSEEAFVAGLLYGIGMLAFMQEFGDTYIQFKEHVQEEGGNLSEQEQTVFGFCHATLSARMLEQWGFPGELVHRIEFPREISEIQSLEKQERDRAGILRLADDTADFLVSGLPSAFLRTLQTARELWGLDKDAFQILLQAFETEANALAELFNLKHADADYFTRLMTEAHGQLVNTQAPPTRFVGTVRAESKLLESVNHLRRELTDVSSRMKAKLSQIISPPAAVPKVALNDLSRCFPTLKRKLIQSISRCRQARCSISLVLLYCDDPADIQLQGSSQDRRQLQQTLQNAGASFTTNSEQVELLGEEMVVVLLEDYQRPESLDVARVLLETARRHNAKYAQHFKISIGVATLCLPPRNFPEQELIDTAVRCLETARRAGGDSIKSYEL